MIRKVGRQPIERDTLYNIVQDFTNTEFAEDKEFRGYFELPVLN
jgi:aminodeoxyfutalosine synthase